MEKQKSIAPTWKRPEDWSRAANTIAFTSCRVELYTILSESSCFYFIFKPIKIALVWKKGVTPTWHVCRYHSFLPYLTTFLVISSFQVFVLHFRSINPLQQSIGLLVVAPFSPIYPFTLLFHLLGLFYHSGKISSYAL